MSERNYAALALEARRLGQTEFGFVRRLISCWETEHENPTHMLQQRIKALELFIYEQCPGNQFEAGEQGDKDEAFWKQVMANVEATP